MASFDLAFKRTMHHEAGYARDPLDPGGETWRGISRRYWPTWEGWQRIDVVKLSLPNATRQELEAALFLDPVLDSTVHNFYIVHFWSKVAGDDIPVQSLAEEMFDSAVNLGPERAVRWLQAALNALNRQNKLYPDLKEDGRLGRRSMDALRAFLNRDASSLLYKLLNVQQGAHYLRRTQEDETMEKYIRGWLSRVEVSKRGGLDGPDANQGDEG